MSYYKIAQITVGDGGTGGFGSASEIVFENIPQIYRDLVIVFSGRSAVSADTGWVSCALKFNYGVSNKTAKSFFAAGSNGSVGSNTDVNASAGLMNGGGTVANSFGDSVIYVSDYSSSTKQKTWLVDSGTEATASASALLSSWGGLWASTSPVTSIGIYPPASNIAVNSTATLYGVGRIPTASLGATSAVDYLVVAGGGAGNQGYINAPNLAGGGGGAGGMLTGTGFSVPTGTPLTVTVGAGSSYISNYQNALPNGSNSVFSSITASGGGGGGMQSRAGANGGSGGGGGGNASAGGTGIAGQGFAGGTGNAYPADNPSGDGRAGGGGGAGGVGVANAGGPGAVSTLTGVSLTYAKGGDGALYAGGAGASAQPNTGNGGNGAGGTNTGGNGGSGVVIIRYPDTYNAPSAVTGNPAVKYVNGYRVYTWTNNGSITF